uniref:Uncharacterized protein n=1 Tax=Chromera velia CCMP2878 TaxID=1169474 RepID=A0A0G4G4B8_9ALVE|eukprot:Cvel_4156.t1-p1 / transcript=Cvel_4156.t1 / gene=Cvel_4156 / organism=Chromera_velia_CCMP2878 / gene_product=hypothetical protein / transcript_product=hypothetical protein / location=Cvel_scaffold178:63662-66662(+) / protein_length=686 / sequence_SO=supercontig / SO=protein_coding / is_pseudo=false
MLAFQRVCAASTHNSRLANCRSLHTLLKPALPVVVTSAEPVFSANWSVPFGQYASRCFSSTTLKADDTPSGLIEKLKKRLREQEVVIQRQGIENVQLVEELKDVNDSNRKLRASLLQVAEAKEELSGIIRKHSEAQTRHQTPRRNSSLFSAASATESAKNNFYSDDTAAAAAASGLSTLGTSQQSGEWEQGRGGEVRAAAASSAVPALSTKTSPSPFFPHADSSPTPPRADLTMYNLLSRPPALAAASLMSDPRAVSHFKHLSPFKALAVRQGSLLESFESSRKSDSVSVVGSSSGASASSAVSAVGRDAGCTAVEPVPGRGGAGNGGGRRFANLRSALNAVIIAHVSGLFGFWLGGLTERRLEEERQEGRVARVFSERGQQKKEQQEEKSSPSSVLVVRGKEGVARVSWTPAESRREWEAGKEKARQGEGEGGQRGKGDGGDGEGGGTAGEEGGGTMQSLFDYGRMEGSCKAFGEALKRQVSDSMAAVAELSHHFHSFCFSTDEPQRLGEGSGEESTKKAENLREGGRDTRGVVTSNFLAEVPSSAFSFCSGATSAFPFLNHNNSSQSVNLVTRMSSSGSPERESEKHCECRVSFLDRFSVFPSDSPPERERGSVTGVSQGLAEPVKPTMIYTKSEGEGRGACEHEGQAGGAQRHAPTDTVAVTGRPGLVRAADSREAVVQLIAL